MIDFPPAILYIHHWGGKRPATAEIETLRENKCFIKFLLSVKNKRQDINNKLNTWSAALSSHKNSHYITR